MDYIRGKRVETTAAVKVLIILAPDAHDLIPKRAHVYSSAWLMKYFIPRV